METGMIFDRAYRIIQLRGIKTSVIKQKLGVSNATLSKWKMHHSGIALKYILPLAELCEISVEYLLTGKTDYESKIFPKNIKMENDEILLLNLYKKLDNNKKKQLVDSIKAEIC